MAGPTGLHLVGNILGLSFFSNEIFEACIHWQRRNLIQLGNFIGNTIFLSCMVQKFLKPSQNGIHQSICFAADFQRNLSFARNYVVGIRFYFDMAYCGYILPLRG